MAALICEVVYRGIFQKNLAARIARGIVLSARKAGRWGIAFGRYGDSPQRNGIPAKDFAIVADSRKSSSRTWPATSPRRSTSRSASTTRCARASSPGPGTGFSRSTASRSPTAPC